MKKITLLMLCALFVGISSQSQNIQQSIDEFVNSTDAILTTNKSFGTAEFVRFPVDNRLILQGNTLNDKALVFLNQNKSIYSLDSVENSLVYNTQKTDNYGLRHVSFKQQYKGIPVYDGELKFHFDTSDRLASINGNFNPYIKISETPSITINQAGIRALEIIRDQNINNSGVELFINKNTLFIFPKGIAEGHITAYHLAYEVEVRNDADVREFVFIDAHDGTLVEQFTGIAHALDRLLYEENTNPGSLIWEEGDALPGSLDQWQQNEVIASGHVYNFFNNAFGHVSYDGADAQMITINNNPGISCPNANWNGATANYCTGTASDDVVAHEWGHAYTEYTSGLIYAFQSGAMNESFSDIWGETVDLFNNYEDTDDDQSLRIGCSSSDRWRMGEDASAFGGAIRDMWNPTCDGDPGKVTDNQYRCGSGDSGGVHSNSGVPNHAYALLVDGGAYNGQNINAIGFTKAAHIFWRAQSVYLTATSDFAVLADALESSAADLIGINLEGLSTTETPAGLSGEVITAADASEVLKAINAVELRIDPDVCGYTPLLGPTDPLCEASTKNPIFFEDWENGLGSWTLEQLPSNVGTWTSRDWVLESALPDNRAGNGVFGTDPIIGNCTTDFENGIIRLQSPLITIPNYTSGTFDMAFNHYISTEPNWDGGNIKYSLNGGAWLVLPSSAYTANPYNGAINSAGQGNDNPMEGQDAFTGSDGGSVSGSWGQSIINLSSIGIIENSTVQFRWEMGTDGCNGRVGWYLDEVMVYNCSEPLSVSESNFISNNVKVYPNPTRNKFTLKKLSNINLIDAGIYDLNGRLVKTINLETMGTSINVDVSDVSLGVYFMKITSQEGSGVIKLIKQ